MIGTKVEPTLVTLQGRVAPEALLAALADRPWPVLARWPDGRVAVASDPVEVMLGEEVWNALRGPFDGSRGQAGAAGGWIGFLSYDLATTIERLPAPREDPGGPPLAALARYDALALVDLAGRCTIVGTAGTRRLHDRVNVAICRPSSVHLDALMSNCTSVPSNWTGSPESSCGARDYRAAVGAVRQYIRAGDCYQVNLVQRLRAPWTSGPAAFAGRLWRAAGPSSHRAYVGSPWGTVVSASPERLVRVANGIAVSEPIKGSAPAGAADELDASSKDHAEHVMIVDLVRNDLGRVAVPGGVSVPALGARLSVPYMEHLVSTVRAELREGVTPADVLRAVFPGGSVTGAPKLRAMEVIHELEPVSRGPAFGSVVAVAEDGSMEASVAIRTAWVNDREARYWCGGGIVWDSAPEAERLEAWAKAAPFVGALDLLP